MNDFKDQAAEIFGLIIAYLLPGILGLFSLSLWSASVDAALKTFLTSASNVNLFLLVIVAALAIGLVIAAIRGLLFDRWQFLNRGRHKVQPLTALEFKALTSPEKFSAFRAIVDAHYRYHQCWGGILIAIPIFYFGWLKTSSYGSLLDLSMPTLGIFALEAVTLLAAQGAYRRYLERARAILGDEQRETTKQKLPEDGNILIKDDFLYIRADRQFVHQSKGERHWYDYPDRVKHVKRVIIKKGNSVIVDQMFSPSECEITIWLA